MGSSVSRKEAGEAFEKADAGSKMSGSEFYDLASETTGKDIDSDTEVTEKGLTDFFDKIGFSDDESKEMAKNYLDDNEDADWGDLKKDFFEGNGSRLSKSEFREAANGLNKDYGLDSDYDEDEDDDEDSDSNEITRGETSDAFDKADAGSRMSKSEFSDLADKLTDGEVSSNDDEFDVESLTDFFEGIGIDGDAEEMAENYLDENPDATLGDLKKDFFEGNGSKLSKSEFRDAGNKLVDDYED